MKIGTIDEHKYISEKSWKEIKKLMTETQQPLDFVFIGPTGTLHRVRSASGEPMLYYKHPNENWVTLRRISQIEADCFKTKAMPFDEARKHAYGVLFLKAVVDGALAFGGIA